jgi:hypothetical protein
MPILVPVLTEFVSKNPEYAEAAMAAAMQLMAPPMTATATATSTSTSTDLS